MTDQRDDHDDENHDQRRMLAMERYWHEMETEIAPLMLVSDGRSLVGLYFPGHRHLAERSPNGQLVTESELDAHPVLQRARQQLSDYLAGRRRDFDLPLDPGGTTFQHRVWAALRDIPYATTHSYGQVARAIGSRGAARAVGMANGRNPLSIIVPCHRVIGSDGR